MFKLSLTDIEKLMSEDVKSDNSSYVYSMIPVAISIAETYCKREMAMRDEEGNLFKDEEGNYYVISESMALFIAKLSEYYMRDVGITYEMISRVARNYSADIPKSILSIIRPYVKVRFV